MCVLIYIYIPVFILWHFLCDVLVSWKGQVSRKKSNIQMKKNDQWKFQHFKIQNCIIPVNASFPRPVVKKLDHGSLGLIYLNILNWIIHAPKPPTSFPPNKNQNTDASPGGPNINTRLAPNQQAFHSKRNSPTSLVCQGFGLSHGSGKTLATRTSPGKRYFRIHIFSLQVFQRCWKKRCKE